MASKKLKKGNNQNQKKGHFRSPGGKSAIEEFYQNVLSEWPIPWNSEYIDTRHGKTHVLCCGPESAPPLILFHGSSTNSAMWMGSVHVLAEKFRIYAIDLPGEPGLSEDIRHNFKSNEPVEWLQDILSALKITKVSILGCSLGGWMALKCGSALETNISKIVLLTTSGVITPRVSFIFKVLPRLLMGERGLRAINRIIFNNQPVPEEVEKFGFLVAKYFIPRKSIPLFTDSELSRLTMPIMLIAGDRDALLNTKKTMGRLESLLPDFSGRIVPNAGHVIMNQEQLILSFLS